MRKVALCITLLLVGGTGVASAATPVTVGHSAWTWGNPQPQGNTLGAIEFAGGVGYATGDFGTLLRTDDGGLDWTGIATGVTNGLAQVRALDASTVIVGGGCLLRRSNDGGHTFTRLPFTPSERSCAAGVRSFSFPSSSTGYLLLGDGTVLRTDNGGQSFARKIAIPGTIATNASSPATATDVVFTGPDTGIVTSSGPGGGTIYRTTDGGGSWSQVATAPAGLNGLFFADATTGYAVGDGKTVYKTTDGGQTWTAKPVPSSIPAADLARISCAPGGASCLAASKQGDRLLRTTDGGSTWTAVAASTQKIYAVGFDSATQIVGVGEGGATVVSSDGGSSFHSVGSRLANSFVRLRATSPSMAEAAGDRGSIALTTDGGMSWSTIGVATSADVEDVSFPDRGTGYALDSAATVLKTVDGGGSWTPIDTHGVRPSAIFAPSDNVLLLIGQRGVARSTNGGATFGRPAGRKLASAQLQDYDRTPGGQIAVYGPHALYMSGDGGAHFRPLRLPGGVALIKVAFVGSRVGYVLSGDGRLFVTRNAGRRWRELDATGTRNAFDLAFGDARNGYMSISGFGGDSTAGYVLRTSDGGRTWRPQVVSPAPMATGGLAAAAPGTVFALSSRTFLFGTTVGGDQGQRTTLKLRAHRKRRKRFTSVTISGRLSPAVPGADVFLELRDASRGSWRVIEAPPVSAGGTFTIANIHITRQTSFVAQWVGDGARDGAGSPLLKVRR